MKLISNLVSRFGLYREQSLRGAKAYISLKSLTPVVASSCVYFRCTCVCTRVEEVVAREHVVFRPPPRFRLSAFPPARSPPIHLARLFLCLLRSRHMSSVLRSSDLREMKMMAMLLLAVDLRTRIKELVNTIARLYTKPISGPRSDYTNR